MRGDKKFFFSRCGAGVVWKWLHKGGGKSKKRVVGIPTSLYPNTTFVRQTKTKDRRGPLPYLR